VRARVIDREAGPGGLPVPRHFPDRKLLSTRYGEWILQVLIIGCQAGSGWMRERDSARLISFVGCPPRLTSRCACACLKSKLRYTVRRNQRSVILTLVALLPSMSFNERRHFVTDRPTDCH